MDLEGKHIFLHICCAPCSIYTLKDLRTEGARVSGYFYNPNIHPYTEFSKRLSTLKEYAKIALLPLIVDGSYELEGFLAGALALGKDRCLSCYRMSREGLPESRGRFRRAHHHPSLQQVPAARRHEDRRRTLRGLWRPFLYRDFRTGWREGIEESKKLGMYRQQYCGCIFSEKERYGGK